MKPKEPDIGTPEWLGLLQPAMQVVAGNLVDERRQVYVYRTNETGMWLYAVTFVDTEFWAGAFKLAGRARAYAARWNKQCERAKNETENHAPQENNPYMAQ